MTKPERIGFQVVIIFMQVIKMLFSCILKDKYINKKFQ